MDKVKCYPGEYGDNVYVMISRVSKAISDAYGDEKKKEFIDKVTSTKSYEEAWGVASDYAIFTDEYGQ